MKFLKRLSDNLIATTTLRLSSTWVKLWRQVSFCSSLANEQVMGCNKKIA